MERTHNRDVIIWLFALTLTITNCPKVSCRPNNGTHSKFLIVGAGVAGLSAAKHLVERGETSFRILEGSERIGGRIRHGQLGGTTLEIGPQWLHDLGLGEADPIQRLATKASLDTGDADLEDAVVYDEVGKDVTNSVFAQWNTLYSALERFNNLGDWLATDSPHAPDVSQRAALELGGWRPQSGTDFALEYMEQDFIYGQPPEAASTRYAYRAHGDQRVTDQQGGLSKIVTTLASEIRDFEANDPRLMLNTRVDTIQHSDHTVIVTTADGERYSSDYIIITVSLGVLKDDTLTFDPPLPPWKRHAIAAATYVTDFPIYLRFPSSYPRFWGDSDFVLYGSSMRGRYTMWQNMEKYWPDSRILQVQLSGDEARRIARIPSEQTIKFEIMAVLRTMYGKSIPDPEDILIPRWLTDPLFRGSYFGWSPAFLESSHEALRAPVGPLYFAGEAYDQDWFGYMQGAYLSGRETSSKILACILDTRDCETYVPPYEARGCTYKQANNYDPKAKVDDGSCDITINVPANHVACMTSLPVLLTFSIINLFIYNLGI